MNLGNRLILVAIAVFGASFAVRASGGALGGAPTGDTGPQPVRQSDIAGQFAGSGSCQGCHEQEHSQWARSLHLQMTRPADTAAVIGDFSNVSFTGNGRAYRTEERGGKRFISVSHGGRPFKTFEVNYTLGAKRFQGYLSRLPDGGLYVLPAFWHIAQKRWIDWKEITPVPDGNHDLRQIWNVTCFNCHATNLDARFDVASKTYNTSWSEMGLGCEACHGPGKPHIALMEEWKRTGKPSPKAPIGIFAPRGAAPRQVFDMCAYCHGNKNNLFLGFTPGDRLEEYALPFLVSQPMPSDDPQGDFWPDGRPSRFNRPQALTLSGCFMKGNVTCTNCHVAHGSRQEHSLKVSIAESDRLCTQCHEPLSAAENVERHTRHPLKSQGSRCIECHMSDVNWRLLIRRRDHTFAAPVPEMTAKYGVPNGCTTCHEGRTPEWAMKTMDEWYGDRERRRRAMQVADTFYLAGNQDVASLPGLASLVLDRGRGMLVRASAAEFIGRVFAVANGQGDDPASTGRAQTSVEGASTSTPRPQLDTPAIAAPLRRKVVNALIGALADAEPAVRASALKSLAAIGDRAAAMAMIARLLDDVRLVRVHAAQGLLQMGIAQLPPPGDAPLQRAQEEWAQGLSAFPDMATNHTMRGWLESQRGRQLEAGRALDTALALDSKNVRAHLYRGIVYARRGELSEAIKHWQTARSLDPSYPNIDRLIEEAKRQSGR
jgi:predicted CXXCH cytochrome family protein